MMSKERQLKNEIHEQKVKFESRLNGFKRELDWQRKLNCALVGAFLIDDCSKLTCC
jgi:hypothetical protein